MAKQNFISGGYFGKLGSTVGQRWKNKRTIRTYVVPKNPRTEVQQANRYAFGNLVPLCQLAKQANFKATAFITEDNIEWNNRMSAASFYAKNGETGLNLIPLYPKDFKVPFVINTCVQQGIIKDGIATFKITGDLPTKAREMSVIFDLFSDDGEFIERVLYSGEISADTPDIMSVNVPDMPDFNNNCKLRVCSADDKDSAVDMVASAELTLKTRDVPITTFDTTVTAIDISENTVIITLGENFREGYNVVRGVTLHGLRLGFWKDAPIDTPILINNNGHFAIQGKVTLLRRIDLMGFPAGSKVSINSIKSETETDIIKSTNISQEVSFGTKAIVVSPTWIATEGTDNDVILEWVYDSDAVPQASDDFSQPANLITNALGAPSAESVVGTLLLMDGRIKWNSPKTNAKKPAFWKSGVNLLASDIVAKGQVYSFTDSGFISYTSSVTEYNIEGTPWKTEFSVTDISASFITAKTTSRFIPIIESGINTFMVENGVKSDAGLPAQLLNAAANNITGERTFAKDESGNWVFSISSTKDTFWATYLYPKVKLNSAASGNNYVAIESGGDTYKYYLGISSTEISIPTTHATPTVERGERVSTSKINFALRKPAPVGFASTTGRGTITMVEMGYLVTYEGTWSYNGGDQYNRSSITFITDKQFPTTARIGKGTFTFKNTNVIDDEAIVIYDGAAEATLSDTQSVPITFNWKRVEPAGTLTWRLESDIKLNLADATYKYVFVSTYFSKEFYKEGTLGKASSNVSARSGGGAVCVAGGIARNIPMRFNSYIRTENANIKINNVNYEPTEEIVKTTNSLKYYTLPGNLLNTIPDESGKAQTEHYYAIFDLPLYAPIDSYQNYYFIDEEGEEYSGLSYTAERYSVQDESWVDFEFDSDVSGFLSANKNQKMSYWFDFGSRPNTPDNGDTMRVNLAAGKIRCYTDDYKTDYIEYSFSAQTLEWTFKEI